MKATAITINTINMEELNTQQEAAMLDSWGVNDDNDNLSTISDNDIDACVDMLDEEYLFCMDAEEIDSLVAGVESAIDGLHAQADERDRIKSIPAYRLLSLGE